MANEETHMLLYYPIGNGLCLAHRCSCFGQLAVCYAQLQQVNDAVNIMARAAEVFGDHIVIGWLKDPAMDVVREERIFQAFTDRVADEETRKWLEQMARKIKKEESEKTKAETGVSSISKGDEALQKKDLLKVE